MLYNKRIPISEFRGRVSSRGLSELVEEHTVVEVGRYVSEVNAVVVEPTEFATMRDAVEQLAELRGALPLILAAVRAGAAIPSETLANLGFAPDDDSWQTLNAFQVSAPIHLSHGADGETLARGELTGSYIPEADLDLDAVD